VLSHEIASITGHASLAEVSRYTKAADQRRLGPQAMARLVQGRKDEGATNGGEDQSVNKDFPTPL
jgi:hypothetical protein